MPVDNDVWGLPLRATVSQKEILSSRLGVTKRALLAAVRSGALQRVLVQTRKGRYLRGDVLRWVQTPTK
jgi:hypothetical protein